MKNKVLSLVIVAAMSMTIMTGCGSNSAAEAQPAAAEETTTETVAESSESVATGDYSKVPLMSEIAPEDYITLGDYKGLEVSCAYDEATEDEIQSQIDSDLKSLVTYEEITNRAVKEGDVVNIDYEGKKDGIAFERGTAQGYDLEIGSGTFIPGFEDGLVGAKLSETRDLNLTFPENYGNAELAGAEVVFTVKVNAIKEKVEPALTDETANQLKPECKTVDEYKKAVADEIAEGNKTNAENNAKAELLTQATMNATVKEYPQWLLDEKSDYLLQSAKSYAQAYGMDIETLVQASGETMEQFEAERKEYAETDAKQVLVVYAIAKAEGLTLTDEEYRSELENVVKSMGAESYDEFINTVEGRSFYEYLQTDKVYEWLFENAKVTK